MTSSSDGQLLRAYRAGDRGAFTELVLRHEAALLRHARALLGSGSTFEDVVQEVFLKLAQVPPELPPECDGDPELERLHLASWLHKVTRNACMDVIRGESRRKRREKNAAASEGHSGGMTVVEERDTRAAVRRELERLPMDQREVLVLRLLDERSYKEIAEITGRKVGTVGWLISVGLKTLGEKLGPLLSGEKSAEQSASPVRIDLLQGETS